MWKCVTLKALFPEALSNPLLGALFRHWRDTRERPKFYPLQLLIKKECGSERSSVLRYESQDCPPHTSSWLSSSIHKIFFQLRKHDQECCEKQPWHGPGFVKTSLGCDVHHWKIWKIGWNISVKSQKYCSGDRRKQEWLECQERVQGMRKMSTAYVAFFLQNSSLEPGLEGTPHH